MFIFSGKNGRSLCISWILLGYSTSTPNRYPYVTIFVVTFHKTLIKLSYLLSFKLSTCNIIGVPIYYIWWLFVFIIAFHVYL